jgi:hypothetical protein
MITYMQDRHASVLEKQLDRQQYNDRDLITIKTALDLPYYASSTDYERAYGSVEVNGVTYEYVKRRVHRDTLELLCLPNKTRTQLQTAENEFLKLSVDGNTSQQQKKPINFKLNLPDYCQEWNIPATLAGNFISTDYFCSNTVFTEADYSTIGEQPPEFS